MQAHPPTVVIVPVVLPRDGTLPSVTSHPDPRLVPVVIASGQCLERTDTLNPVELMARAANEALQMAPALRNKIERLSVVNIMTKVGPAPATELARELGITDVACEVSTIGGNTPQWLVNRAASEIAAGQLSVTMIAGAEAIRSSRARRAEGGDRYLGETALPADPMVGDNLPGSTPAEDAVFLLAPIHVYPLFETALAARNGRSSAQQRQFIGELMAPFTKVAARHPVAWFPEVLTPEEIANPSPANRLVCDPYTKRMTAFLGSDQAAAVIVCSLAAAREAGVADQAVFIWAGAETTDVRSVTARADLSRSPALHAGGSALCSAAGQAAGRPFGMDDLDRIEIYSCFPSAVQQAAEAFGLPTSDPRGLTVTGGLPYFGGPGNNYTSHGIATLTDLLRQDGSNDGEPRFGLATGLGWYITKHALGLYGTTPPPGGFQRADTTEVQKSLDAEAQEVALSVAEEQPATVLSATVVRDHEGGAGGAPVIVRLENGRHMTLTPANDGVTAAMGAMDVVDLVGRPVVVSANEPRYRLAE